MKPETALDFETLVETHYQPVFSFAVRLCGRFDRALELTQHTFCLALTHENAFGDRQSVKPWLLTILFREFLKERRLEGSSTPSVSQRRSTKQAASTSILTAVAKLRKELQAPLILFYAKDFSFSQIADYLGIPVAAVLRRLSQGREEIETSACASGSADRCSSFGTSGLKNSRG
jgi:RNA polymerase sigma factor (sigma-70 family)